MSFGIKLLNDSSRLLQDDPFDVILDSSSHVLFFSPSTRQLKSILVSTRPSTYESPCSSIYVLTSPPSPSIEIVLTFDRPVVVKNNSPISCLPRWSTAKAIEVVRADVNDISFS
jgi:hypothetical protein